MSNECLTGFQLLNSSSGLFFSGWKVLQAHPVITCTHVLPALEFQYVENVTRWQERVSLIWRHAGGICLLLQNLQLLLLSVSGAFTNVTQAVNSDCTQRQPGNDTIRTTGLPNISNVFFNLSFTVCKYPTKLRPKSFCLFNSFWCKSKTKQHSVAPNHHPAILSGMMAKSLLSAATHACRCDLTNQQVKFAPLLMLAIFPSLACGDKDAWTVSGLL